MPRLRSNKRTSTGSASNAEAKPSPTQKAPSEDEHEVEAEQQEDPLLREDDEDDNTEAQASHPRQEGDLGDDSDMLAHARVSGMNMKELAKFNSAQKKRGLIYFSSIPKFMKPAKLRHLMSQYGEVDRVFLKPEDSKLQKRRVKMGGNKKQNFAEGWVEFIDKNIAKRVAASLNATPVGGKKNSFHHHDLWNMKYLPKFKWHHLTERIAYDNAVREKRLAVEMSQVQKETDAYVDQVTQAHRIATAKAHGKRGSGSEAPRVVKQRKPLDAKS